MHCRQSSWRRSEPLRCPVFLPLPDDVSFVTSISVASLGCRRDRVFLGIHRKVAFRADRCLQNRSYRLQILLFILTVWFYSTRKLITSICIRRLTSRLWKACQGTAAGETGFWLSHILLRGIRCLRFQKHDGVTEWDFRPFGIGHFCSRSAKILWYKIRRRWLLLCTCARRHAWLCLRCQT